jgi:hypothetical protein
MSITRHHNEWLSLVPNSGPFLSLPVLAQAFPQGLDAHEADHARRLRMAFDEWDDNQLSNRPDPSLHRAWLRFVLGETLGYDELLADGQAIPQSLKSDVAEYGETLRPDWIVNDPATKKARLLVQVYPRSQSLTKPVAGRRWNAWPDGRMMQLLHDTGIRLGIVTNGDHWMLVNAPKNETTGYVTWHANLWLEEPVTLRAFRTVLGADRLFSVPDNETLEALLDKSANDQQEVTDQLGYQVRKAVEVLIQALDKADQEHGRKLLGDVNEKVLYESALTVMMRLVFLFCAEERELLLLGDDLYDKNYAVSTLREQLRVTADQFGEEILGLRYDAWTRLLTTFRAVYAGAKHDRLKLPAYGGSLFNPDRFPFLEGRKLGTNWKNTKATPLPVSNRTVLHLLEALQVLQTKIGNTTEARKISFRALDIEQIGHVYEGLLDHTAKRATEPVLGLAGTRDKEPEIALAELEKIAAKGEKELLKFLKDESGRSESAIKKGLNAEIDDQLASRFRTVCQDSDLRKRVKPFAGLVRLDDVDYPVVITTGSVFVTSGTDRRSSGTHYTPKSLTEPIVQYTLEPLVYVGPAEGLPKDQWKLRSAKELLALKICDMACGSGAFLVQACRYMAARLLEAWDAVQRANPGMVHITPEGEASSGKPGEMLIPDDPDERQTYALRIVAQRCLYGVDKNPLAAEMAKLSLWLLTLAKDKPFEFLDHAIRCGDSLVGIQNIEQLRKFDLQPNAPGTIDFPGEFDEPVNEAMQLRRQITEMQGNSVEIVNVQERMLREATEKIDRLRCAADLLIGAEFLRWDQHELIQEELDDEEQADSNDEHWQPTWLKTQKETSQFRRAARTTAWKNVVAQLKDADLDTFRYECSIWLNSQTTFHWPLEFPEVMVERGGFDAFVGNPPFMVAFRMSPSLGENFTGYLKNIWSHEKGRADLSAYFVLNAAHLLRQDGNTGLISTKTISQEDNRRVALDYLISRGYCIYRASPHFVWPGEAAVHVAVSHLHRGPWLGKRTLDGELVNEINGGLEPEGDRIEPYELLILPCEPSKGINPSGKGFIITRDEAEAMYVADPRNREVVKCFLNGAELNASSDGNGERFVIDFGDLSKDKAMSYELPWQRVEETVAPQRAVARMQVHEKDFWKFEDKRPGLSNSLETIRRAIVFSQVSKYFAFAFVPSNFVFSSSLWVVPSDDAFIVGVLQSSLHIAWAHNYQYTLKGDPRYSISSCYRTFPFPRPTSSIERRIREAGEAYHQARSDVMRIQTLGLRRFYDAFHDCEKPTCDAVRQLQVEMDNAVAAAYGWTDLDLDHGFHQTKQGVRYTISEPARREVLARLLKLNHERYAEEVKQGLHEKKKGSAKKPTTKKTDAKPVKDTATLFDMQEDDE